MDHLYIPHSRGYCSSPLQYANMPDLGSCSYTEYSTDPSPSPPMMFASLDNLEYSLYAYPESAPQYPKPEPPLINTIEFMDLTAPQHDSRRRRRSNTAQDKEAVSNMRIRRRAQNRASQRAFRERKEKHVQRLEQQLEDLETKHRDLTKSYADLGSTHDQLKREAKILRGELELLRSSREHSASASSSSSSPLLLGGIVEPIMRTATAAATTSALFDPFASDDGGLFGEGIQIGV